MRTTKDDIRCIERRINDILVQHGYNTFIHIEWVYGKPHAVLRNGCTGDLTGELSPRMPTGQMKQWLYAYLEGLKMGLLE